MAAPGRRSSRVEASADARARWASPASGWVRRHALVVTLVLADVATKLAAFAWLPHGESLEPWPGLRFHLAVNEWGVMGGVSGLGPVAGNPVYTMLLAAGLLGYAWLVLRLAASARSFPARLGLGVTAFFLMAFVVEVAARPLAGLSFPLAAVVPSIRFAALVLAVALYAACRSPWPRTAFGLLAAGALANAASFAYPPFEVVDFLVVPVEPVLVALGDRSATLEPRMGVINLADLYVVAAPLALASWPAAAALSGLRRMRRTSSPGPSGGERREVARPVARR